LKRRFMIQGANRCEGNDVVSCEEKWITHDDLKPAGNWVRPAVRFSAGQ